MKERQPNVLDQLTCLCIQIVSLITSISYKCNSVAIAASPKKNPHNECNQIDNKV